MHELGTTCTRSSEYEVFPVYLESASKNEVERVAMKYILSVGSLNDVP